MQLSLTVIFLQYSSIMQLFSNFSYLPRAVYQSPWPAAPSSPSTPPIYTPFRFQCETCWTFGAGCCWSSTRTENPPSKALSKWSSTATMSIALRFIPLNQKENTVGRALLELVRIDLHHLLQIFQGERIILNVKMPDQFMPILPDLPPLQKVLKVREGLVDLGQRQGNPILVIPTTFLPVFFRDLLVEETKPGQRSPLHQSWLLITRDSREQAENNQW